MSAWQTKHNHKTSRALNLIVIIENSAPSVRHYSFSIPAERSQSAYMGTRSHQSSHYVPAGTAVISLSAVYFTASVPGICLSVYVTCM